MSKSWTELGSKSRRVFRCEDTTSMGTRCRRLAKWRYGEKGAMADKVVCGTHKAKREREALWKR
jgi:hypothetical protein